MQHLEGSMNNSPILFLLEAGDTLSGLNSQRAHVEQLQWEHL